MEEHLKADVHPVDGFTAVDAAGEIDLATAPELRGALERTTGRVVVERDATTTARRAATQHDQEHRRRTGLHGPRSRARCHHGHAPG